MTTTVAAPLRLASVDILRGLTVAAMLLVNNAGDWSHVWPWLEHAAWHGCRVADYIFPLFLFIAGASLSLALEPALQRGAAPATLARATAVRALRILAVGLILHIAAAVLIPERTLRIPGVLQRIGLCLAIAGPVAVYLRAQAQWALLGALVLGYGALLAWGGVEQGSTLNERIDTALLGRFAYQYNASSGYAFDPEGILSTLGAQASTLLGLRAGHWLRTGRSDRLIQAGIALAVAGGLWNFALPFNKALWTPSYVLWTGGFALLVLALTHQLSDRRGLWLPGRALGLNAILAYAGSWLMVCLLAAFGADRWLYAQLFERFIAPAFGPQAASAAWACAVVALWWGIALWLHRRRWYWKV